ncbi:MAG TPA: efflux RND transporter periplasmic adaptor subunit [Salinivirga sp.]|uniref:efflux RND transporter periplasmic adaptor subunit n=1 Tax=Salinivirga sp. TaxID=1970192 RepID=UPI002B495E0D|nr:efflux RND transporter periplasmic adaptor subunit [Salinivirga sp.]HKK60543.1 efflux RND transporter periplasmic adaptor subunit [Salinivirga sp.]
MACKTLILMLISVFTMLSCREEMNVAPSSLQVDTVKQIAVSGKYIVLGELQRIQTAVASPFKGSVKWLVANGDIVNKGDTIATINSGTKLQSNDKKERLIQVQNRLEKNIELLQKILANKNIADNTTELIAQLKAYGIMDEKVLLSLSNADQLENILHEEIKATTSTMQRIAQLQTKSLSSMLYHVISPEVGELKIIESDSNVKPGQELGIVFNKSDDVFVFHAERLPRKSWNNIVNIFTQQKRLEGRIIECGDKSLFLELSKNPERLDGFLNTRSKLKLITEPENKILIKRSAVNRSENTEWVFKKDGNTFKKVQVGTRHYNGALLEIISGLHHNDQIIVSSTKPIWDKTHLKISGFYAEN